MRKTLGYGLLIISCVAWAILPIIPFLSAEAASKVAWAGGAFVFAELTWWAAIALLGKEVIEYSRALWEKLKATVQSFRDD